MNTEPSQIPIWVVSLTRSAERRASVCASMQAAELEYEFFDAIDGRSLSSAELSVLYDEARCIQEIGRPMSLGEIGCSLSHRALYEKLLATDSAYALIMEDDIEFSSEIKHVLSRTAMFPSGWDVVHLCWEHGVTSLLGRKTLYAPYQLAKFIYHSWGSYAYLVSRHAAARMLELNTPIVVPPDHLPQGLNGTGLAIFGIEPTCAHLNQQLAFDPRFNTLAFDRFELQVSAGQRSAATIQGEARGWIERLRLIKRRLDPGWIL